MHSSRGLHDRSFFDRRGGRERRRAAATFLVSLALLFVMTGCGSSISDAVRSYEHARYPEALDELSASEADASAWAPREATRYALYRGLSHWALGDLCATRSWLARVERSLARDPSLLTAEETARLASARAHLPR